MSWRSAVSWVLFYLFFLVCGRPTYLCDLLWCFCVAVSIGAPRSLLFRAAARVVSCGERNIRGALQQPTLHHLEHGQHHLSVNHCGNWQERYKALHASIKSGNAAPRYAVSVHHAGLADSLVKAVWVFYYALLTDRAFLLGFPPTQDAHYEWAYEGPNVNWTDGDHVLARVNYTKPTGPQDSGVYLFNNLVSWDSQDTDAKMFADGDLASKAEQAETVVFWKGSGKTFALFDNPHYKKRLLAMGLRPDTAVGCALNFLFEPNAAVKAVFEREFTSLSQPQVLRIGIQIRTSSYSDAAFFDKEKAAEQLHMSFWDAWFECAQQIEDDNVVANRQVLWYLLSDSQPLREFAKEKFGDKLLVTIPGEGMALGHSTWGADDPYQAFISAAGENWLFGMTDYQVVTGASYFGKVGALRSMGWHNLYSLWVQEKDNVSSVARLGNLQSRQCGKHDYEHLEDVSARWFGI